MLLRFHPALANYFDSVFPLTSTFPSCLKLIHLVRNKWKPSQSSNHCPNTLASVLSKNFEYIPNRKFWKRLISSNSISDCQYCFQNIFDSRYCFPLGISINSCYGTRGNEYFSLLVYFFLCIFLINFLYDSSLPAIVDAIVYPFKTLNRGVPHLVFILITVFLSSTIITYLLLH